MVLLGACQRFFDTDHPYVGDSNHTRPHGQIGGLKVELLRRKIRSKLNASRRDRDDRPSAKQAVQSSFVECEQHVLLRYDIDQMLEAIRDAEVPHGYAEENDMCVANQSREEDA